MTKIPKIFFFEYEVLVETWSASHIDGSVFRLLSCLLHVVYKINESYQDWKEECKRWIRANVPPPFWGTVNFPLFMT